MTAIEGNTSLVYGQAGPLLANPVIRCRSRSLIMPEPIVYGAVPSLRCGQPHTPTTISPSQLPFSNTVIAPSREFQTISAPDNRMAPTSHARIYRLATVGVCPRLQMNGAIRYV